MSKFNGHKNWNHWNVSLWINDDEGLYTLAKECIADNRRDRACAVADFLRRIGETHTPDGAPYSASSVRAAMVDM